MRYADTPDAISEHNFLSQNSTDAIVPLHTEVKVNFVISNVRVLWIASFPPTNTRDDNKYT